MEKQIKYDEKEIQMDIVNFLLKFHFRNSHPMFQLNKSSKIDKRKILKTKKTKTKIKLNDMMECKKREGKVEQNKNKKNTTKLKNEKK